MFVTGPEVVKTVTHEEVTAEELGGAVTHTDEVGRGRPRVRERRRGAADGARACSTTCRLNNREKPPVVPTDDPADRLDHSLDTLVPDNPNKPYDIKELILKVVDDGEFFELAARLREEHRDRASARMDGATGRHRRQPAAGAGRLPRHQVVDQGGALRALLRRVQHPDRHLRRRARLHARHRAGIRRHHQARRQAALRLRRVHGAQGHRDHAQGLRRRLRRHVVQAPARRRQLRLADRPRSR